MVTHKPVLVREVLEMLDIEKDGVYLDATAGGGGHSREILRRLSEKGRLYCSDRDESAIERLAAEFHDSRVVIRKARFSDLIEELGPTGAESLDGMLLDLGVSTFQLRDAERGFSFDSDTELDMRMDRENTLTAWQIVNTYPEKEIARILWEYADERLSRRIARAIVKSREKQKIGTCRELASIVSRAYGRRGRIHPATRTFQALRIAVNREMEELAAGLDSSLELLKRGGKICVISYHSIEDRIVKNFFRAASSDGKMKLLAKKPLVPSGEEMRENPSSRSAKLRGAERL